MSTTNRKVLVALVTGANKGIGKGTARELARRDVRVVMGVRDIERGRAAARDLETEGLLVDVVGLDVTDESSVQAAAETIEHKYGKLDILVNNAGISLGYDPELAFDARAFTRTFDTNLFGMVRVTSAMLPLLRESSAARVVNLSSTLGSLTITSEATDMPMLAAYNGSKTAVNALTVEYAQILKPEGIKVNAADPGYTATDLNNYAGPRTVEQGAAVVVHLATLTDDGPTGGYFDDNGQLPW